LCRKPTSRPGFLPSAAFFERRTANIDVHCILSTFLQTDLGTPAVLTACAFKLEREGRWRSPPPLWFVSTSGAPKVAKNLLLAPRALHSCVFFEFAVAFFLATSMCVLPNSSKTDAPVRFGFRASSPCGSLSGASDVFRTHSSFFSLRPLREEWSYGFTSEFPLFDPGRSSFFGV